MSSLTLTIKFMIFSVIEMRDLNINEGLVFYDPRVSAGYGVQIRV